MHTLAQLRTGELKGLMFAGGFMFRKQYDATSKLARHFRTFKTVGDDTLIIVE